MRKLLLVAATLSFAGCALAPQSIQLNEHTDLQASLIQARAAQIMVVDERDETDSDVLGSRGGMAPEKSPLKLNKPLTEALTNKLESTLLAFGFSEAAHDDDPVRVKLTVEDFSYQCNEGLVVNDCAISMRFAVVVQNGNRTFKKPYGRNQQRSLAASPVQEYNQTWVNEELDKLWQFMFNDQELKNALDVQTKTAVERLPNIPANNRVTM